MKKIYFFLVPVLLFVLVSKLTSGDGEIAAFEARLQYEPHFEYNGNYELPPILIRFLHPSDHDAADSKTDLTYGEAVQILLPYTHTRDDPAKVIQRPSGFQAGNGDIASNNWNTLSGTFVNVLTFDHTNANEIEITGNAAVSFDTNINSFNFYKGAAGGDDARDSLAHLRSISLQYQPTGKYLNTTDLTAGADIHKGSTFWINRDSSQTNFIGYNPEESFGEGREAPYIVITGLRVWTGPFVARVTGIDNTAVQGSVTDSLYTDGPGFNWSKLPTIGNDSAGNYATIDLVATVDSINSAYLLYLRVSDDSSGTGFHWAGNRDNDGEKNIHYDAHPFVNKFYVGGPRVSIDEVVNYNLFTELSKPIGQKVNFPDVTIHLPSGRITYDTTAAVDAFDSVSADEVLSFYGATDPFDGFQEWTHLASSGNVLVQFDLTLPGSNSELFWSETVTSITKTSNLRTWSSIGTGSNTDRGGQLIGNITTNSDQKILTFRTNSGAQFLRFRQEDTAGFGEDANIAHNVATPSSPWRDGPLQIGTASDVWGSGIYVATATGNGGTIRGDVSEALTLGGLQVKQISSLLNPSIASERDIETLNDNRSSRLYGQLGLQIYNAGTVSNYYKTVAENFLIVSGGPVMTASADASQRITFKAPTAGSQYTGYLELSDITIVHDQDDWIGEDGIKLSFKSNSGLYFIPYSQSSSFVVGPEKVTTGFAGESNRQTDVEYQDFVTTSMGSVTGPGDGKLARSVMIQLSSGGEADDQLTISSGLLVTYDPIYLNSTQGWPIRHYTDIHQGTNGLDSQSIVGNLMLLDNRYFDIDAVLDPGGSTTILANLVRAENAFILPPDLSMRSARDRMGTTFDHITARDTGNYQVDAISMDAIRIVFQNDFSKGDLFLHFPSQVNGRVGAGTFDSTAQHLNFGGSARDGFNKINVKYGTAGRYVRIRRTFAADVEKNTDLVITGLRYFPSGEDRIQRLIVGYPDEDGKNRLATVTDARVIGHQLVTTFMDRPVLLNPHMSATFDSIYPFPDLYVSHDGREVVVGTTRQDTPGDLRFALPGAGDNLRWSSDFSRIVYYFTTRDRVTTSGTAGDHTFGTDGTYINNAGIEGAWQDQGESDAKSQVARFIDIDLNSGNQGGLGQGLNVIREGKILALDVVDEWPPGSTLRITGLLIKGLDTNNTDSSHISNNIPTYATLTSGNTDGEDTVLLEIPGGQFTENPLLGHLALNYLDNETAQTFTPEPVYVSGLVCVGVTQEITHNGSSIPTISQVEDNLNRITIIVHEETNFEVDVFSDTDDGDTLGDDDDDDDDGGGFFGDDDGGLFFGDDDDDGSKPNGFARGVTSDGIRLTFPYNSPLRFLTADTTATVITGSEFYVPVLYENIDKSFDRDIEAQQLIDYGGFARTAWIRFVVRRHNDDDIDIFGFTNGDPEFVVPAGTGIDIEGLTVVNVKPFSSAWTGYAPGIPNKGTGPAEWPNMGFGHPERVPGIMLSLSSAGAVDAYLFDGPAAVVVNTGSDTGDTEDTSEGEEEESLDNNLFNACLISHQDQSRYRR